MKGSRAMPPSLKRSPASKTNTPAAIRKLCFLSLAAPPFSEKPKKRLSMRTPQAKVRKIL